MKMKFDFPIILGTISATVICLMAVPEVSQASVAKANNAERISPETFNSKQTAPVEISIVPFGEPVVGDVIEVNARIRTTAFVAVLDTFVNHTDGIKLTHFSAFDERGEGEIVFLDIVEGVIPNIELLELSRFEFVDLKIGVSLREGGRQYLTIVTKTSAHDRETGIEGAAFSIPIIDEPEDNLESFLVCDENGENCVIRLPGNIDQ